MPLVVSPARECQLSPVNKRACTHAMILTVHDKQLPRASDSSAMLRRDGDTADDDGSAMGGTPETHSLEDVSATFDTRTRRDGIGREQKQGLSP